GPTSFPDTAGFTPSNTAVLTVHNDLTSIDVAPASQTIAKSSTQQFTATGHYEDSSTATITGSVTWNSDTTAVATINASGLASGVGVGTAGITATLRSVTSNTATLTVTNNLVSIAVTPASPSITAGATQQFTATGTYQDTSTANITGSVTWNSATPSVATINSSGLATGVAAGTSG